MALNALMKCSIGCLVVIGLLVGCDDAEHRDGRGSLTPIKVGISRSYFGAPSIIAVEADTFTKNGLLADIHRFESGKKALAALLTGQVDVATVADMPLIEAGFKRQDFAIISTFSRSGNQVKLLALADKIRQPSDLTDKKVGVAAFTTADYYLQAYLKFHNLDESQIHIVNIDSADLVAALQAEQVDAIVSWEPYISQGVDLLGQTRVREMAMTNVARVTFNLVALKSTIQRQPAMLTSTIAAYGDAIKLMTRKPSFSAQLIAGDAGVMLATVLKNLTNYQFYLGIDQGLVFILEDQAQWLQRRGRADYPVPNVLNIVETTLLQDFNPSLVTLIK